MVDLEVYETVHEGGRRIESGRTVNVVVLFEEILAQDRILTAGGRSFLLFFVVAVLLFGSA